MNNDMADKHLIAGLESFQLEVKNLNQAKTFYSEVFGLEFVGLPMTGFTLFRANGTTHHVVELVEGKRPRFVGIELSTSSRSAVDLLVGRLGDAGFTISHPPAQLSDVTGGGYGATVEGVEGLGIQLVYGRASHSHALEDRTKPLCLTHVVINSNEFERQINFFVEILGFRVSDITERMTFLRCGADHHTIALAHGDFMSLNHAAFAMEDFDSLMYGSGRLLEFGHAIEWGPGRHGPGNNVFCYFIDPEGFAVEYTTDMDQVDESYEVGSAEYWTNFPKRPCRWGVAGKPSEKLAVAFAGKGLIND